MPPAPAGRSPGPGGIGWSPRCRWRCGRWRYGRPPPPSPPGGGRNIACPGRSPRCQCPGGGPARPRPPSLSTAGRRGERSRQCAGAPRSTAGQTAPQTAGPGRTPPPAACGCSGRRPKKNPACPGAGRGCGAWPRSPPPGHGAQHGGPGGIRSCSRMKVSTVFNNGRTSFPVLGRARARPYFNTPPASTPCR